MKQVTGRAKGYKYFICDHCETEFTPASTGRPPKFCSNACKQKAYREREEHKRSRMIESSWEAALNSPEYGQWLDSFVTSPVGRSQ